jgi:pyrroloquinoline quinone biosynthesis protein D
VTTLAGDTVPRLARGMRLSEDRARNRWVIQGPERLFVPDETAMHVLQLIDGARTLDQVIDQLAQRFDAPRDEIAADVNAMLADLVERKVVVA